MAVVVQELFGNVCCVVLQIVIDRKVRRGAGFSSKPSGHTTLGHILPKLNLLKPLSKKILIPILGRGMQV